MSSEQLRILWTVVGLTGSSLGLLALVAMWLLRKDAERYVWAISQVAQHPLLSLLRQQARDDLSEAKGQFGVATIQFLTVAAMTAAGFAALLGQSMTAIPLLIASEVVAVAGVGALVMLGVMKMRRRNAVRQAVRLQRDAE